MSSIYHLKNFVFNEAKILYFFEKTASYIFFKTKLKLLKYSTIKILLQYIAPFKIDCS